jgi:hypothetical protein
VKWSVRRRRREDSARCLIKYVIISGENEIERDFRKSKACVFVRKEFLFSNYK